VFYPCVIRGQVIETLAPRCLVDRSLILVLALLVAITRHSLAADPQKEILDSLRAKGDYAAAADYLVRLRANPALPKDFGETIDYELAVTHIDAARQAVDGERDKHYELAQETLQSFLAGHPKHALAPAAKSHLGSLLLDRGRLQRCLGEQREGAARQKLMEAARGYLGQSDAAWSAIDSAADDELNKIVFKRGEDIKRSLAREEIHRRQAQARLARAWAEYETALTWPPESAERAAAMQKAATRFDAVFEQQRERLGGYYARLGRGLCYRESGDMEKAFAAFEQLLRDLPDQPADFHALRGKAAVQALEISLLPEAKKTKQGVDIAQRWVAGETPAAAPDEADRAIGFLGAEAAAAYLKSLPPPSAEQTAIRGRLIDWMRQQYTAVAAATGPYQSRAKVRLLDPALGAASAGNGDAQADAVTRAKAALDRMVAAETQEKNAQRSGSGNDPDAQRQWRQQISAARSEALKCGREALAGPPAAAGERRDMLLYYLAFLHYDAGDFEESAAEGEAVLQAANESPAARQAAKTGLAAREMLFHASKGDARVAALARLRALADKIVQRWSSYPEADDARAVLTNLALVDKRLDKAGDWLRQIAERSPRRGEAEMGVGQALWAGAQQLQQTSTIEHDHTAEAEKLIARAAELLGDGITRCRGARSTGFSRNVGEMPAETDTANDVTSPAPAGAILALAQIEMFLGRASEAAALLEDGSAARADDAASLQLLAYIAVGNLDKARGCLQSMSAALPQQEGAERGRQMVQICVRFQRLEVRHLDRFRDRRMDEVLKHTEEQLAAFLAAPAEGTANSFFVRVFCAEALAGLAAGLDSGGPAVPPGAQQHYRRAIAAFQDVLHRAATERNNPPHAEVVVALRIELARCLRRMSDNAGAMNQLLTVLNDHPRMVDAQIESAYTYQSWGDERPEFVEMAIQGGDKYPEVWGWGELARRVQSEGRFREAFFEARYNLALCRFRQAQTATQRPERSRLAEAAEEDILATRRVDRDLGSQPWYDKYNELFQRIQRVADQPAVGMPNP
jgi:tetratricopeptide (TPR) repeat protein